MTETYLWVVLLLTLFFGAIFIQKYNEKQKANKLYADTDDYVEIQKYLLDEKQIDELGKSTKPIMWIHIPLEYNARYWQSFGSRSSYDLNQPYLYLTVKSIIQHCDNSFKICFIDDASFHKLLPGMDVDMTRVAEPVVGYIRQMLLAKLLYKYGGMVTPISFLCFQDLIGLYAKGLGAGSRKEMFVCENMDRNITSTCDNFYPDARFMGAQKGSEILAQFIEFMQRQISRDYTSQIEFLGEFNRWINARPNQISVISGTEVGTKTLDDAPVIVDTLLGSEMDVLNFYGHTYGIWIPADDILKRTRYNWFARMSPEQVVKSNTVVGRYILLAVSPDRKAVTEALTMNDCDEVDEDNEAKKPNWISFWKTPSGINVWGPKPKYLGKTVPRASN
jgi:hypothetical protein